MFRHGNPWLAGSAPDRAARLDRQPSFHPIRILRGSPPLGPGADPAARLAAFPSSYAVFLNEHLDLVHLSETARPGARYEIGSYRLWHRHVVMLITLARPDLDADYLAHALVGPVGG